MNWIICLYNCADKICSHLLKTSFIKTSFFVECSIYTSYDSNLQLVEKVPRINSGRKINYDEQKKQNILHKK